MCRYTPTGKYCNRFKLYGQDMRRSFDKTVKAVANHKLMDLQRARSVAAN